MIGEFSWETLVGVVLGLAISFGALWGVVSALDALMKWAEPTRSSGSGPLPPTDNENEVYHRFHDHR